MMSDTSHIGLLTFAREFERTAADSIQNGNRRISLAVYYLLGHAIELALKSYLAKTGLSESELRGIGHNLESALETAQKRSIDSKLVPLELVSAIQMLNPYYSAKELEYFIRSRGMQLPKLEALYEAVTKLTDGLNIQYRRELAKERSAKCT